MKKVLLIMSIFLLTNSCAGLKKPRLMAEHKGIDPVFNPYIEKYRDIIGKNNYSKKFKRLHMNIVDLEPGIVGRCWWLVDGDIEIEMDKQYWDQPINSIDKEFTVFHELEHCVRFRGHTNRPIIIENISDFFVEVGFYLGIVKKPGLLPDGCPASLMHSHVFSLSCQLIHYNYYIDEMKNYEKNL